jgi:hypothetical protein
LAKAIRLNASMTFDGSGGNRGEALRFQLLKTSDGEA